MENTKKTEVHQIIFFDYTRKEQIGENEFQYFQEYSANVKITLNLPELSEKKKFIIQFSGNEAEAHVASIPDSSANLCGMNDQDWACENLDAIEIGKLLEKEGEVENNFGFFHDHGETLETI